MTYREIDYCLRRMHIRKHNEFAQAASLHGIKIPLLETEKIKEQLVNPANSEKAEKAMEQALKRRGMKQIGE